MEKNENQHVSNHSDALKNSIKWKKHDWWAYTINDISHFQTNKTEHAPHHQISEAGMAHSKDLAKQKRNSKDTALGRRGWERQSWLLQPRHVQPVTIQPVCAILHSLPLKEWIHPFIKSFSQSISSCQPWKTNCWIRWTHKVPSFQTSSSDFKQVSSIFTKHLLCASTILNNLEKWVLLSFSSHRYS